MIENRRPRTVRSTMGHGVRACRGAGWGPTLGLALTVAAATLCLELGQARAQKVDCDLITVHLHSHSSQEPLTRTSGTVEYNPPLNSPLVLTCSSEHPGDFSWLKNGNEIPYANSAEYRMNAVQSSNGGVYKCMVNVKRCGVIKSNIAIINTPPAIAELQGEPRIIKVGVGDSFTLTCSASGWPVPQIQWSIGGHVIQGTSGDRYTVPSAQLADSGDYTCSASNSRSSVNSTYVYKVMVQGHPGPATKGHDLKQGSPKDTVTTRDQLRSLGLDSSSTTGTPDNKKDGGIGSTAFVTVIVVCVILAVSMVIVIVVVSIVLCAMSMKSCKRWFDSRRTGDKAHLIPPDNGDDGSISELNGRAASLQKNGSAALAGVAAALTAEDNQEEEKTEAKKRKKKKPRAGFKSKKVQPELEADELPMITNVDDPWNDDEEDSTAMGVSINVAERGPELVVVENGVKREGGDGADIEVAADVVPEIVALSVAQQQAEEQKFTSERQEEAIVEERSKETAQVKEDEGGSRTETVEAGPVVIIEESGDSVVTVEIENDHEDSSPLHDVVVPPTVIQEKTEEELLTEKAKKLGRSMSFVKQLSRSRPLGITEISQLVYGLDDDVDGDGARGEGGNPLFAEYNSIPQNTPVLNQSAAEKSRNRYRNVLPNPHSAVKLGDLGEDGSTYINANYIQGYKKQNAYIATQGPIGDTMADFWRMVWEKNASIIVMLTGIIERGRHKCAKYWPYPGSNDGAGEQDYGNIRVRNNFEENGQYYNITGLTITNTQQGAPEEREVYHFAYKAWPDFGVPKESNSLLDLVEVVNNYRKQQPDAPIVVHCSAGLGRSGAFMAIDMGIHQYEQEAQVDPLKYLCDMRSDRGGTIQTPEQYVFIHKALADYMMARMK